MLINFCHTATLQRNSWPKSCRQVAVPAAALPQHYCPAAQDLHKSRDAFSYCNLHEDLTFIDGLSRSSVTNTI